MKSSAFSRPSTPSGHSESLVLGCHALFEMHQSPSSNQSLVGILDHVEDLLLGGSKGEPVQVGDSLGYLVATALRSDACQ